MDIILKQLPRANNLLFLWKNLVPASRLSVNNNFITHQSAFHSSPPLAYNKDEEEEKTLGKNRWVKNNQKVFPPQLPHEERRPAVRLLSLFYTIFNIYYFFFVLTQYVCHVMKNIKYSPFKMWYVASMIRGMSIDEALKQLSFVNNKGAPIIKGDN